MNLARLFSFTRHVEQQLADERQKHAEREAKLERENTELLNKLLGKLNVTPMFYQPPKSEPVERPPVGVTAKANLLAERRRSEVQQGGEAPSAEEIVEAARVADMRANGNGHG